jgi:hypothetical protein
MEWEMAQGNKKAIEKLRARVEEYLEKAFNKPDGGSDEEGME